MSRATETTEMVLTLELPESVERRLAERAAKAGKSVAALAVELIEQALESEEEFGVLIVEAREEVRQEQRWERP